MIFENLQNSCILDFYRLVVVDSLGDTLLDALKLCAQHLFLSSKRIDEVCSPDEACRFLVLRGQLQNFLIVVEDARDVAADGSLPVLSRLHVFGLLKLQLSQGLPVFPDLLLPVLNGYIFLRS